jgi:hypothetical protein
MNILQVHNPNHLETIAYTKLVDFQGDLKDPIEPDALRKMRESLKKHGVFVPKFVWFDDQGQANILDGHQTVQGLASLEADGWTIPPIPYVKVEAVNRTDAAEKLLQINSQFDSFDFPDIPELFDAISIPSLDLSDVISDHNSLLADEKNRFRDILIKKFIIPPFSVFDTSQGYGQQRKQAGLAFGIKSELGRGGDY